MLSKLKWSGTAASTLKLLLVPDRPDPEVVIVMPLPDLVTLRLPVQDPFEKAVVVVGVIVPVETVKVFVPV